MNELISWLARQERTQAPLLGPEEDAYRDGAVFGQLRWLELSQREAARLFPKLSPNEIAEAAREAGFPPIWWAP